MSVQINPVVNAPVPAPLNDDELPPNPPQLVRQEGEVQEAVHQVGQAILNPAN